MEVKVSDEKLEGRVRALEALIIEIGATPQPIAAAKKRVQEAARRRYGTSAEMKEKLGVQLDEEAENALDSRAARIEREI